MDLYIIRHADAGNRAEWTGNDADRPLSPLGRRQAKALGEAFRRRGITLGLVATSPLARAWQTAADFREAALPGGKDPQLCDLLVPGSLRRRKLSKFLTGTKATSLAIVGHDPDLPGYLAWLLGTDPEQVPLEKGGAALVRCEDEPGKGEGVLQWVVTPEWYMPEPTEAPTAV
jgi:phosphohistidine phosphatase